MSSAQVEIAIDQSYIADFLSMTVGGKIYMTRSNETDTYTVTHCVALRNRPVYRNEFPALAALERGGVFLHMDWTKFYYGHDVHVPQLPSIVEFSNL